MAADERAVERLRAALSRRRGVSERRMFGGVCFFINGNMCCGVDGDRLALRVGEEAAAAALREAYVRPFDLTGRALRTMVLVEAGGFAREEQLRDWVALAARYARSLPAK